MGRPRTTWYAIRKPLSIALSPLAYKIPISVLVVIHTRALDVLLLERAQHPGFWQSVTGSQDPGETLAQTALREVREETGLTDGSLSDWHKQNVFEIYSAWRSRYAPGVRENTENVFGLLLPERAEVRVAPLEHSRFVWLPWQQAAAKVFSWSNRDAILELPHRLADLKT